MSTSASKSPRAKAAVTARPRASSPQQDQNLPSTPPPAPCLTRNLISSGGRLPARLHAHTDLEEKKKTATRFVGDEVLNGDVGKINRASESLYEEGCKSLCACGRLISAALGRKFRGGCTKGDKFVDDGMEMKEGRVGGKYESWNGWRKRGRLSIFPASRPHMNK